MSDASILSNLASQASGTVGTPAPALRAGQVVAAQVLTLMKDGMVRLALPQGTIDVVPPTPLMQGAAVKLEVVKAGPDLVLRLVNPPVLPPGQSPAPPPAAPIPPPTPGAAAGAPFARPALPQPIPVTIPANLDSTVKPTPERPVEGRVVAFGNEGAVRIATPRGELTVTSRMPVPLGATVRVEAPAGGQPTLSVIPAPSAPAPAPSAAPAPPATGSMPQAVPAAPQIAVPQGQQATASPGQPVPQPATAPLPGGSALAAQLSNSAPIPNTTPTSTASPAPAPTTVPGSGPAAATPALPRPQGPVPMAAAATALPTGPLRAVLLPALQTAMGRQQGLAPLMANLETTVSAPQGASAPQATPALPAAVTEAAGRVLGARLPLDGAVSGEDLARAVASSGVLFEAKLAQGAPPASVTSDLKGALLLLRNALQSFVSGSAPGPDGAPPAKDAPSPPLRGDPPAAQRPGTATIAADTPPEDIGRTLLSQTEGALARTRLSQIASLPDDTAQVQGRPAAPAPLHVEIPVVLGQQNAVAQFTVERDGHGQSGEGANASLWRMRFALDVEPMGPVHALITLRGEAAAVTLWAERPETANELSAASADLRDSLDDAEFIVDEVLVRRGAPPKAARQPGGVVDRRT